MAYPVSESNWKIPHVSSAPETDYAAHICPIKLLFQFKRNNYCMIPLNYKYLNIFAVSRGIMKLETDTQNFWRHEIQGRCFSQKSYQ